MKSKSMQTPLGRVRGLGSARKGVGHWWTQRLTAMGMIPLVIYLIIGLLTNIGADHAAAMAWLGSPFNATAALLLFGVGFYHASLGLQVIIEDYVSNENRRLLMLVAVKLGMTGLAALSLFSVLSIAFA
ncbi:MAG: succinate dehydrogenase, hydrophobic membrane anchor protein [Alphaproteobacteria bacterium]|nr:succinate dehydrogenase, hydrophobic membrane anchor protein [Alphaproteobacteria bacterium]